jgi:hypothetical protein
MKAYMSQNSDALKDLPRELEWQIDIPLFDRFIARNVLKLLAICAPVLGIVAFFSFYAFIYISSIIFFTILLILVCIFYIGHRQVRFRIDSKGAAFITPRTIKGANKIFGYLVTLLGISQGRVSAVVIGWSQASLPSMDWGGDDMDWNDVRAVALYPREHVVTLKEKWFTGGLGGGLRSLRLYCTLENYEAVAAMCNASIGRTRPRTGRLPRPPSASARSQLNRLQNPHRLSVHA